MDKWSIVTCAVVGGTGTLVFLKIVSNEVAFQLRALELRAEAAREEKEKQKQRARQEHEAPEVAEAAQIGVVGPGDNGTAEPEPL